MKKVIDSLLKYLSKTFGWWLALILISWYWDTLGYWLTLMFIGLHFTDVLFPGEQAPKVRGDSYPYEK